MKLSSSILFLIFCKKIYDKRDYNNIIQWLPICTNNYLNGMNTCHILIERLLKLLAVSITIHNTYAVNNKQLNMFYCRRRHRKFI